MKRNIVVIISFFLALTSFAQDIESLFYNIPEGLIMQVEPNRRRDMVDMIKDGRTATFPNRLGGRSTMTDFTDTYIKIDLSGSSSIELKLLPYKQYKDSTEYIIAVSKTTCAPACDSELSFYDMHWKRLKTNHFFEAPNVGNFFYQMSGIPADEIQTFKEARTLLPMYMIKYSFYPENDDMVAELQLQSFLPKEVYEKVDKYIESETKTYV